MIFDLISLLEADLAAIRYTEKRYKLGKSTSKQTILAF